MRHDYIFPINGFASVTLEPNRMRALMRCICDLSDGKLTCISSPEFLNELGRFQMTFFIDDESDVKVDFGPSATFEVPK